MSLLTTHVFTNKTRLSLSPDALFYFDYYHLTTIMYLFAREAIECQFCPLFGFLFGF